MPPNNTSVYSVREFIHEAKDDFHSPTTSNFYADVPHCKNMINLIEENLDLDRNGLSKMKKAVKAIYNNGCAVSENKIFLSESLEKLGINTASNEKDEFISAAFIKFSFIVKELSQLEKTLMQNFHNTIMFPVDSVLKGDLKGVKNDLKKPVDKAFKEYEIKMSKIEKEKKAQAKEAGLIRTEITGAEIAEEMDRERKQLQYQMCEYLIKVNEIEVKKSFDLLMHFIDYFNSHCKYFRNGLEAIEQFEKVLADLTVQLQQERQRKEDEKRELIDLKNLLKSSNTFDTNSLFNVSLTTNNINNSSMNDSADGSIASSSSNRRSIGYSLHQLQGNKQYGCYKCGYLLKKSEGKMRVKVWQKRKCEVKDGCLYIWHSDEMKTPTKVNLLTCQIKTCQSIQEDKARQESSSILMNTSSNSIKNYQTYFDLISYNRTYHFQVEDEHDVEAWISVIINNKEGALKREFDNSGSVTEKKLNRTSCLSNDSDLNDQGFKELSKNIIEQIQKLPGNDCCVDCGSLQDPTWLSTNFGVLTCIECSGIHRKMGVHVSRIQSLTLDNIGTSHLLIARAMSNNGFNEIMEAGCSTPMKLNLKPKSNSSMEERNQFIRSKYMYRKYTIKTCASETEWLNDLEQAVLTKDILFLLQVWSENADFSRSLPSSPIGETVLHIAIKQEQDGTSLHIVDFIVQNSSNLDSMTSTEKNTALHYCVIYNRSECMKLLLRSKVNYSIRNSQGKTPLDLAKEENNLFLIKLLESAEKNQKHMFENVIIDWSLPQLEDQSTDFSDDDLDEKNWVSNSEETISMRRFNVNNSINQNGSNWNPASRKRSSKRKFSFKYLNDNESDSNDQNKYSISKFSNHQRSNSSSRPSSVVGDIRMIQVEPNNPKFSCFKPLMNDQFQDQQQPTVKEVSHSARNRRETTQICIDPKQILANEFSAARSASTFVAGHSRAASADISHYSNKQQSANQSNQPSILNKPIQLNTSNGHHIRNNSVDNSLVVSSSPYQTSLIVNNSSRNSSSQLLALPASKPVVPAKPSGIVSVFVPGCSNSMVQLSSNTNNSAQGGRISSSSIDQNEMPSSLGSQVIQINNSSSDSLAFSSLTTTIPASIEINHPVPPPRKKINDPVVPNTMKFRRCQALYDCDADQIDELSFKAGEVITVINEVTNDEEWMEGIIENDPTRRGLFPIIFVQFIS